VAIDREQSLKRAEKLLRQGRLDAAIAEYGTVVAEFPKDWATANLLGDLFVRAGQIGQASQHYAQVAEHLAREGFTAKAVALYKKIIKLNPTDESALLRSAELAASQGLTADVRTCMTALFQYRMKRGDRQGAIQLAKTRVAFDPSDVVGRLDAARMLAEAGDVSGAAGELRVAGLSLASQGRRPDAIRTLREALRFAPSDDETRTALVVVLTQEHDLAAAGEVAQSAEQLRMVVTECRSRGDERSAHAALVRLVSLHAGASDARVELARACLDSDDVDEAARWASVADVIEWPALAMILAEVYLRQRRADEGQALLGESLSRDPSLVRTASAIVDRLVGRDPAAASAALLTVVDAAVEQGDAAWARGRLESFLETAPGVVVAWRRYIELCVDSGLDAELRVAQLSLTDALLAQQAWGEARVVAEDLAAADPADMRVRERLSQALRGLGLDDEDSTPLQLVTAADDVELGSILPTGMEASGDPPNAMVMDDFSDLVAALSEASPRDSEPGIEPVLDPVASLGLDRSQEVVDARVAEPVPESLDHERHEPEEPGGDDSVAPRPRTAPWDSGRGPGMGFVDGNLRRLFEDPEEDGERPSGDVSFEIDLSEALDEMLAADGPVATPQPADEGGGLDQFFKGLRRESEGQTADADRLYLEGEAAHAAGQDQRAAELLRAAARDAHVRFRAARLIAKIAKERGDWAEAVDWLERASEVPAPTEAWQALLFELGETLETFGEHSRALAVFMELRAATPGYPGVDDRIQALSASRAGHGRPGGVV
jgi:tetratricopeptide (TPR) repeat protein